MKQTEIKLDKRSQELLDKVRIVPALDPQVVAQERAKFLDQAEEYRTAVSESINRRQIGWINTFVNAFHKKERIPMLNTLMAIFITMILLFGGAGSTMYAAQASLPDEVLYPLKTWSETLRLALAGSSQAKLELTLKFTNHRIAEIAGLLTADRPVPEGVADRLQEELDTALQIAAGMDDPQMIKALKQIRSQAEFQAGAIAALLGSASGSDELLLKRIMERLQEQARLAAFGEIDPQGFRLQVQTRDQQNRPSQTPAPTQPGPASHTPGVTPNPTSNKYGPGPGGNLSTEAPGQYGPGYPHPSQTPAPTGSSYGPGPGSGQQTSTPGGNGPGPSPSRTSQAGGPSTAQPITTQEPGGPWPGGGQPTDTQNGNNGDPQPTQSPGQGGGHP